MTRILTVGSRRQIRIIQVVTRWCLVVLFLAAGAGKLLGGAEDVSVSRMLVPDASEWTIEVFRFVEDVVPWAELFVSASLAVGSWTRLASWVALLLGIAFVAVAISAPAGTSCQCFGVLGGFESRSAHFATAALVVIASTLQILCNSRLNIGQRQSALSVAMEAQDG